MSANTGGPAFPMGDPFAVKFPPTDAKAQRIQQGMTLRDYFAAKALQAIMESDRYVGMVGVNNFEHGLAKAAYAVADAMLQAREA